MRSALLCWGGALSASVPRSGRRDRFRLIMPFFFRSKRRKKLALFSLFLASTVKPVALADISIEVGGIKYPVKFIPILPRSKRSSWHVAFVSLSVSVDDVRDMSIHNKVRACIGEPTDPQYLCCPIAFDVLRRGYTAAHGPLLDTGDNTVMFFRQSRGRSLVLTVRNANVTDGAAAKVKIRLAWLAAKIIPSKRPVIIFEKNSRRYEESGRAVFEALVDRGEPDVRFFIADDCWDASEVDKKYSDRFVGTHTFRHYFLFFRSRCFIGTEALAHALELRCQSLLVYRKTIGSRNKYVFLQHGVMYMISLDSPQRVSFRKDRLPSCSSVVVSSELERDHFVDLAGFDPSELIVSGLPKFDRSWMDEGADKILIMPTWRFWEFNQARNDFSQTGYARMVERIIAAIPEHLSDKIIVAPHPLMAASSFAGGETGVSYDVLLRSVRLLITDYSSIAYDAFYRGANVVFYWEELEECMEHYGSPTHLMLNETTAFGDVRYTPDDLAKSVQRLYGAAQPEEYVERYRKIVKFHDGKNTERLIEALENNGITYCGARAVSRAQSCKDVRKGEAA